MAKDLVDRLQDGIDVATTKLYGLDKESLEAAIGLRDIFQECRQEIMTLRAILNEKRGNNMETSAKIEVVDDIVMLYDSFVVKNIHFTIGTAICKYWDGKILVDDYDERCHKAKAILTIERQAVEGMYNGN